jgi:DNA-binding transcriptional LysR family regulator
MKNKSLRGFNLNALPALLEILKHGSLTKAAVALNLTQPALSNILKQLRLDFDDQLIIRDGKAMRLTPKGTALLVPLERSLQSVKRMLTDDGFDAAHTTRKFRIATTDHIMSVLGGSLTTIIQADAPDMSFEMIIAQFASIKALIVGDIDMIITPKALMSAGPSSAEAINSVTAEPLFSEPMVCIGRSDDAELAAGLSIEAYLARPHVGFSFGDGQLGSMEQVQLARQGFAQKNVALVSSYGAIPKIVAQTGCLAIVPGRLAQMAKAHFPLQIIEPPITFPSLDWTMVWHKRNDQDLGMQWLRNSLLASVPATD